MVSTTTARVEVRDQDQLVAIPSTIKLPDGKDGDKVAPFLQYLQVQTSLTDERRLQRHWINIHWKKVRQLIGRDYAPRIKELERAGIIEVNHRYSTGQLSADGRPFPMSYRFGVEQCHGKSVSRAIKSSWAKKKNGYERFTRSTRKTCGPPGCTSEGCLSISRFRRTRCKTGSSRRVGRTRQLSGG